MHPELAIGYLGLLLFMIGDGVEAGFLSPMLIDLHFTTSQVAIVFTAYGATAAVASWLSGNALRHLRAQESDVGRAADLALRSKFRFSRLA